MKYKFYLISILFLLNHMSYAQESNFKANALTAAVISSNSEKSLHFYKDILGLQDAGVIEIDSAFAKRLGLSDNIPFHVDVLKFSDSPESPNLKIVSFNTESKAEPVNTFIEKQLGLQYLTLNVHSLNAIMEAINNEGIKTEGETPIKLAEDRYLLLVKDPDGVFIELIGDYEE
ncbi:VOC family protein [Leeuwenhoekiella sp. MAR_2009_132]|uniref:VOC family protein n=1 Tax=Leeuwenhoekiella sp. MAR_2009_132 TaxID=1392489 RepID=UPI0009DDBC60|nr:VOC family protein [Leeuwenhoekiella sp. MAR_2009_132]